MKKYLLVLCAFFIFAANAVAEQLPKQVVIGGLTFDLEKEENNTGTYKDKERGLSFFWGVAKGKDMVTKEAVKEDAEHHYRMCMDNDYGKACRIDYCSEDIILVTDIGGMMGFIWMFTRESKGALLLGYSSRQQSGDWRKALCQFASEN